MPVMHDHIRPILGKIKGNVTVMQIKICKPFLDHMLLIAAANDKFVVSMGGIHLHDMPKNRLSADLDHRLGFELTFLTDAGAKAACQNYNFHTNLFYKNINLYEHKIEQAKEIPSPTRKQMNLLVFSKRIPSLSWNHLP